MNASRYTDRMRPGPRWSLARAATLAGGRLTRPEAGELEFGWEDLSRDSRTITKGQFYVALRGEQHDGHDYLRQVAGAGATGALVDRPLEDSTLPQIVVDDTLAALQRWAAKHRRSVGDLPMLALTGSSGKTTTKDLLACMLADVGPVHATEGNLNNHIGVPWTLLGLAPGDRVSIVEMGMNHPGEISRLSCLAAPTAALITDIGTAHVGHLGTREAVLEAKLEILDGLPSDAPIVLPHDPWVLERLPGRVRGRAITTFGMSRQADWHTMGPVGWSLAGTRFATPLAGPIETPLLGQGAVLCSLAALAAAAVLGFDAASMAPGLGRASRRPLRMEPRTAAGVNWILDCYNASPESTRLAIQFLREVPHGGRRILVLGELGELGEHSRPIHEDLGRRSAGVECVLFVGEASRAAFDANRGSALPSSVTAWAPGPEEAAEWLRPRLREGDLVLLKGARRLALERIPDHLGSQGTAASRGREGV